MTHTLLNQRGFSLVELLVVIGIIIVLVAIIVPATSKAFDHAAMTQCVTNFAGIYKALAQSLIDNQQVFPDHRKGVDKAGNAVAAAGDPAEVWWASEFNDEYGTAPELYHCPTLKRPRDDYGHRWSWSFDQHNVGYGYNAYFLGLYPGVANAETHPSFMSHEIVQPSANIAFGETNPNPANGRFSQSLWWPTSAQDAAAHEGLNDARHSDGGVVLFNDGNVDLHTVEDINPTGDIRTDIRTWKYWDPRRLIAKP